jgi:hypothetical protein
VKSSSPTPPTPPWTPLFLGKSAVVTDLDSLIGYASIVARDLGIAVVATQLAIKVIRTGDHTDVDGDRGLSPSADSHPPNRSPRGRVRSGTAVALGWRRMPSEVHSTKVVSATNSGRSHWAVREVDGSSTSAPNQV